MFRKLRAEAERENGKENKLMFDNRALFALLLPIIIEQILNSFMGMVDTVMVSNVGSAAISAVSLVDSINNLVIQVFSAMAAGAAIVCSRFIGAKDRNGCNRAARQVVLTVFIISMAIMVFGLIFRVPLLQGVFGAIEPEVMENAMIYFLITVVSYPFLALFNAGAAFFRAESNAKLPMFVAAGTNILNIAGNAVFIFGMNMGVAGAALSTLLSRVLCMVIIFVLLRRKNQMIVLDHYFKIRPEKNLICQILSISIPSGVENSMFQLGKLAIQSTVSTLGTTAIAAQAMTNILENLNGMAAIGVGVGLMTIVGQCMGADRKDEAVYYIKKLSVIAEVAIIVSCLLVFALIRPVTVLGGMEPASAKMCFHMVTWITLVKPIVWTLAFVPAYGLRAAGDVKFSMITSCLVMWLCRFCLCVILIRFLGFGPMGVWIGMFADWTVRAVIFTWRFHSRRWLRYKVI
mgnify:CR=1 FL=1